MHDIVTSSARRERYLAEGLWDDETLVGRVTRIAAADPDRVAVVDTQGGPPRTYAELERDAELVAAGLREIGLDAGDVASVQLPNRYEAVVCALAVQMCHAVINPLLPNYRRKEIEHVFTAARPKVIFTPGIHRGFDHPALVREAAAAVGVAPRNVVVDGDPGAAGIALASLLRRAASPARAAGPPAAAVSELIFTSGTEANPKAIMHTEQTTNFSVRVAWDDLHMAPDDVVWMPSPVGHSTGFNYGVRFALYHGLKLVLQDTWNADIAAELIDREGCSYTLAATTFLQDLVTHLARNDRSLHAFPRFGCGGAPVPAELVTAAAERNITVLRLYGSTEVLVGSWCRPESPIEKRRETDGRALSHVETTLRSQTGEPCAPGEPGELFTRGPNTCVGFFDDPARTAETFDDGWVRSGDLLVEDADGYLTVVGRKKEIIIRGGLNIAPREIEDLLVQFPEVSAAAVIGLPDARLGERSCACVVLEGASRLDFATMIDRLRATGLATYKLPEQLEVIDEIPRTASGKIQKHVLVSQLTVR
jgi:non-ribosomal peptide synthetase component E (peptide arylation enzyme)